jgi:phage tail sheath protein FI
MPEYLSPGVYVEEVDTGSKPIEGVATSTVGLLGITERGPVAPTLITSFSEYVRVFGRYVTDRFLPYAVEGFFQNGGKRCFIMRVASRNAAATSANRAIGGMTVQAIGPGGWGNRTAVKVTAASLNDGSAATSTLFKLTVMYWDVAPPTPIVDPTESANAQNPGRREPALLEIYDNLSPDPARNSFYERQINGFSDLITVTRTGAAAIPIPAALDVLANGNDGPNVDLDDFKGDPTATINKRGLFALDGVDEIAILVCPDEEAFPGIGDALIDSCELLKDRFAIIQAPFNPGTVANHRPPRASKYAAYYYPWLRILDPITKKEIEIPPGGHVAGIYARSDIERGVHKAPANELIRGLISDPQDPARALQIQVTKGQQDILNPRGVNVLRYFPGRGPLVWGARTTTLDPDWKYINVRRLFIFVEESIDEATQWVVFEPNDEPLWARVRRSVSAFLTRLWMDGMLQGRTKEEAYFVRCDRTTMTQADIDNGRLIMLIGIAPVKPAEFVIFRIGQWSGGSEVTEG